MNNLIDPIDRSRIDPGHRGIAASLPKVNPYNKLLYIGHGLK